MRLEGAVALITGGARGLGRAFGEEVLKNGGKVALLDILEKEGKNTEKDFRKLYRNKAKFIKCDVTNEKQFEDAFIETRDTFGQIDIVVNNAGIGGYGLFSDKWKRVIEIDLNAVIKGSLLAMKYMGTNNGGKGGLLVNVASSAGLFPTPFEPIYGAAKHGVVGFSRSVALIYEKMGITVGCLCPAFADTEMVREGLRTEQSGWMKKVVQEFGVMEISEVVRAFRLIVDEEVNGGVVMITKKDGIRYKYPTGAVAKL